MQLKKASRETMGHWQWWEQKFTVKQKKGFKHYSFTAIDDRSDDHCDRRSHFKRVQFKVDFKKVMSKMAHFKKVQFKVDFKEVLSTIMQLEKVQFKVDFKKVLSKLVQVEKLQMP